MSRRDERDLAARLARALDGHEPPEGDVLALVAVLERATAPARFHLDETQMERELERVRAALGRSRPRARPASRLGLALAAAAVAAVAIVVFTFVRVPGTDLEAKALAALRAPGKILEIEERIEPVTPGAFPASTRTTWLDTAHGFERSVQMSDGRVLEETLVKPGRITRYLPGPDLAIVASSCRAFAAGCAGMLDPVAFYRKALAGRGPVSSKRVGDTYELTFPVQMLPDAVRIEQVVTIDAKSYLPRTIEWREQQSGGKLHPVSRIVVDHVIRRSPNEIVDPFHLSLLSSTKVEQRTVSRKPLRKLSEQRLTPAQARAVSPRLLGLPGGPDSIVAVHWNVGTAYRLDYGDVTVWNFTTPIPPSLVADLAGGPQKVIPLGRNVARFYPASGLRLLVEVDTPSWSVAIEAPDSPKLDVFRLAERIRPLP